MINLIVAIFLMFGVNFTTTDTGQVKVSGNADSALKEVRENHDFERLGGEPALNAVVILDGTDGKQ